MHSVESKLFDDSSPQLDRFGALLGLTAVTIVLQSLIDVSNPAREVGQTIASLVLTAAAGATVLLAFRAAGLAKRWMRIADILVGIAIVGLILVLVLEIVSSDSVTSSESSGAPPITFLIFSIVAPIVVVWRLGRQGAVSVKTLAGAVATYLLIANAFNYAFVSLDQLSGSPFFGQTEPTTAFMYFSLVTITTLGYGDLAPVSDFGRLLAASEAVVGQVFLVTFVGIVVGLLVQERQAS